MKKLEKKVREALGIMIVVKEIGPVGQTYRVDLEIEGGNIPLSSYENRLPNEDAKRAAASYREYAVAEIASRICAKILELKR